MRHGYEHPHMPDDEREWLDGSDMWEWPVRASEPRQDGRDAPSYMVGVLLLCVLIALASAATIIVLSSR